MRTTDDLYVLALAKAAPMSTAVLTPVSGASDNGKASENLSSQIESGSHFI
jgi:hypothetical protein